MGAAELVARARAARGEADSSLRAYVALVRQDAVARVRIGMGHERLGFRYEGVQRVRWAKHQGVVIDVLGSRAAIPLLSGIDLSDDVAEIVVTMQDFASVPHFPGREAFWPAEIFAKASGADERHFIHPLATGAEAYYSYRVGDSLAITTPGGRRTLTRELRVAARRPAWNLVVGSFWFDSATSQLVRAAYRPALPLDISERRRSHGRRDVAFTLRPMRVTTTATIVEYGLYGGRWWLPKLHRLEGEGRVNAVRIPFVVTERFEYESVDAELGTLPLAGAPAQPAGHRARTPSRDCRSSRDTAVHAIERAGGALTVTLRVPCDTQALAAAFESRPSDVSADVLFGDAEAEEIKGMLKRAPKPGWSPRRPVLYWGARDGLLRFNRVEGLSVGAMVHEELGRGWSADLVLRIGSADLEPRAELSATTTGGRRDFRVVLFHRLAVSNDWGNPLTIPSSLRALLLGRDEGFYYGASGAELTSPADAAPFSWRAFVERQTAVRTHTQLSLPHVVNGQKYPEAPAAEPAWGGGASVRWRPTLGLDPDRLRALGDVRLEAVAGDFEYVRGAADVRLARTFGTLLAAAVGAGGGGHAGRLPVQRAWFLGGMHTVRGQPPGAATGDTYALAFAELGAGTVAFRPTVFFDVGRAWDRALFGDSARTLAGAGIGLSLLDGLVRTDVAYGLRPRRGWQVDVYARTGF